jgi:hypothetical protein
MCILHCAADQDVRADAMHSYKLVSELQHVLNKASAYANPAVLRVTHGKGHQPTPAERFEMLCFAAEVCGAKWCWAV